MTVRTADLSVTLPPNVTSPVSHLLPLVARSILNIAPERVDQLKEACRGLHLEFLDDRIFRCFFRPDPRTIVLSTGAVEVCRLRGDEAEDSRPSG